MSTPARRGDGARTAAAAAAIVAAALLIACGADGALAWLTDGWW